MAAATLDYERLFHAVIATTCSPIVIVDDRLVVSTASRAFLETFQASSSSISGRRLHEVLPVAFHALEREIREAIASGRTLRRQRMISRAPSAPLRTYDCAIHPVRLRKGSRGAILVMDDVTDLLRLEEETQRMRADLAGVAESVENEQMRQGEKLAALGMVIGGIAHEIRRPLGVSSAAAQLMRDESTSPALFEECVGKVVEGIERAAGVLDSLLRFARPGPIATTAAVDVVDVVKNALSLASGEAAAGIAIDWRPPSTEEPIYAEGVPGLLELVVLNLVQNAFQAMPCGGRLTVAVQRDDAEVVMKIGDTGPGIPEACLSKIFDPFFTTRSDRRRSGLGLSVSNSIVRQHGGSIAVHTAPGDGATFIVRIPVAQARVAAGAGEVS